ncbi:MAG: DUF4368 domain-containing protein [Clostridium sp.]|nr:DUF4368 domain-containing protein [Clostridium sp.]
MQFEFKLNTLQTEIDAEERRKHSAVCFPRTVKKYTDIQELAPIILNELVEKIVVHHPQGGITKPGATSRLLPVKECSVSL